MEDFNKGFLSGRVAKKTVRRVNSKSENNSQFAIANINLAVNYYDRSEKEVKAIYFPMKIVGRDAEYIEQYIDVGDELYVSGEWRPNEWTGKDGEKHKDIYLEVKEVKAGRKKKGSSDETEKSSAPKATSKSSAKEKEENNNFYNGFYPEEDIMEDDDLPF